MTVVSGDIRLVTNTPAAVSQVWVRAPKPRTQGLSYVSESSDTVQVDNGVVEFNALPGAAVMVLVQNGVPTDTVKLIVPDKETASLRECIDAVGLVDDGTMSTLEQLALDVAENVSRIGGTAQIDTWVEEAQTARQQAASEANRSSDEADRSGREADRAKQEAVNSATSAGASKQDADRSERGAERSASEAARSGREADRSEDVADASEASATRSENAAQQSVGIAATVNTMRNDAKGHADRAEFAANETIAQVEGDFATRNYVDEQKWAHGIVPASTNSIQDLKDGSWTVGSASLATRLGLPTNTIGRLVKTSVIGGNTAQWTAILPNNGGIPETWVSSTNAYGVWGEWVTTVAPRSTQLVAGTDWNTLIEPGYYHRRTTQDDLNAPTNAPGSLLVTQSYHSNGHAVGQLYMAYAGYGIYYRGLSTLGAPSPWTRLDVAEYNAARRDVTVDAGLARRGHKVGTAGLGAVAFRFDHHLQQFGDKVLPLLKKYRIPWSQAINPGNIGQGNDTMSFEELTGHVHDSGGEIWNHGMSHSDFGSATQADAELGASLKTLRDAMPSVWIDSFAAYGSGAMMGLAGWDTPEKFWDTYGGRLLLSQHCFVSGLYSGQVRPLGGPELIGAPYAPIDTLSVAQFKSRLDSARDARGGVTFMLHPNRLDTSGYLSLSDFEQMLSYAAAERDAGRVRIVSTAGRSMADSAAPDRTLLANAEAGSINVSKIRSVPSTATAASRGVPHELEVWVKADGDVTLAIDIGSPTKQVNVAETFSLGGVAKRLSLLATPPLDATTQSVTVTGACAHTLIKYRPI